MDLLRKGKVKDVYDDGDTLVFKFSDRISVFDKIIPSAIPHKGESLCRTSGYWYNIASSIGVETDMIELISDSEMRVKKYRQLNHGYPFLSNFMVPLEFITRYYLAGSLFDRIKSGEIDYHSIGFKNMPVYGEKLPDPFFEVSTKFEKFDRYLDVSEALEISGLKLSELYEIREIIFKIDRRINSSVESRGLLHADGKKEFALGIGRNPVIIDTFGTLDEDRFWDKNDYNNGQINELSKEMVRQYYRESGYHKKLLDARDRHEKEPEIAPLPENMVKTVSDLYIHMYEKITGLKW
ncbi:phosphoribosylaminoimidazolesuccinocarboxamide synthase [Ferroplasma sp.]|uniref:phosphoribosylaminoimidazolesuccinocarboxamide synthase n=1 Tax=Ferroplasma sp. TaxID=2591003 RepID=UPI002626EE7E|nr:phosphoribosylaminoimidazolesuccinocarboxamide synthase [Ferroplasma sp.]MCL4453052.1 phosphoribosylaminoimidazolesuccinocarboxamide synthase [Candidatus Thermoplasmatota archaeon]